MTTGPELELQGLEPGRGRRCAVLALNGASGAELARAVELADALGDRFLLVGVDGGWSCCVAAGRRPDLFVGDGDSVDRIPDSVPAVRYPVDKEFRDLAGALRELPPRDVQVVVVCGLLGGRFDHEWANLLEVAAAAGSFEFIVAPADRGTVVVTARGVCAAPAPGTLVSLLALAGEVVVSLAGTRWELKRSRLPAGSLGLSNRTVSTLRLTVQRGVAGLLFPAA